MDQRRKIQYYVVDENVGDEFEMDARTFHRHCIHPSREQLTFDELGKIYTNISRRKILSKASISFYIVVHTYIYI